MEAVLMIRFNTYNRICIEFFFQNFNLIFLESFIKELLNSLGAIILKLLSLNLLKNYDMILYKQFQKTYKSIMRSYLEMFTEKKS